MARFFVACQPQLEKDLVSEIENFWHQLIDLDGLPTRSRPEFVDEDLGGVEIDCDVHLGFQVNLFSKLANRVLWRIHKFESRFFDQFEKELKKFDIAKFIGDQKFHLNIESSKSRLFHEKNLTEAALKVFKNAVVKSTTVQNDVDLLSLYIRVHKDQVTLSLDTSGRHLHKRGYRLQQGEAPIRETLAAKMYNYLLKRSAEYQISYRPDQSDIILLDPFCGSGTLLFEAASFFQPHLQSTFDFERFQQLPALMKSPTWKKNYKTSPFIKNHFLGLEKDPQTYVKLLKNADEFQKFFKTQDQAFQWINEDSKTADLQFLDQAQQVFIITNPPYGERLKNNDGIQVLVSMERIKNLKGLLVVHPADWVFPFKKLKLLCSDPFNNQGLDLRLSFFSLN